MICPNCGNEMEKDAAFCNKCGYNRGQAPKSDAPNNNIASIIIVIVALVLIFSIAGFIISRVIMHNRSMNQASEFKNTFNNIVENYNAATNNITNTINNTNNTTDNIIDRINQNKKTYSKFDISKISVSPDNNDALTKKIEIKDMFYDINDHKLYVYGVNNNSDPTKIYIYLDSYDRDGYRVDRKWEEKDIYANSEFVIDVRIPDDKIEYQSIKLTYKGLKIASYNKFPDIKKLDVTHSKDEDGNINIVVKNNSNIDIFTSEAACLYYKNNKLVYAQKAHLGGIKPGNTADGICYHHNLNISTEYAENWASSVNYTPEYLEYDTYKVVLQSAYDYNNDNY